MKYKTLVIAFAILVLSPVFVFADIIGDTDAEVEKIGEPFLANIFVGIEQDQYAIYTKDFDETLLEVTTEKQFFETRQWLETKLGSLESKEYLGFLSQAKMTFILWKAKFSDSENDVLIKLVMSKRGENYVVTGLWFE